MRGLLLPSTDMDLRNGTKTALIGGLTATLLVASRLRHVFAWRQSVSFSWSKGDNLRSARARAIGRADGYRFSLHAFPNLQRWVIDVLIRVGGF
jgi:hypothetical protein